MTTKTSRPPGRPRRFDPERGVAIAQRLFHERGYDAVSVADLTAALGVNPPSFYAAYRSKAALYARTLARYTDSGGVPLGRILLPGRPPAEALAEVLDDAARRYSASPDAAGCLAIEGARCANPDARDAARSLTRAGRETIRRFVAATDPDGADLLADYVVTVMIGLSALAREGHDLSRLRETAALAAAAIGSASGCGATGRAAAIRPDAASSAG